MTDSAMSPTEILAQGLATAGEGCGMAAVALGSAATRLLMGDDSRDTGQDIIDLASLLLALATQVCEAGEVIRDAAIR